jgi:hypothetical protein
LIKEKETLFAFNQMKRVLVKYKAILQDVDSLSMLYEEFRLDLSNLISSQNTGWFDKKTEEEKNEFREKMSKQSKGRLPIKYPDGTTTVISTTHPDYISGLAVHVHSGTTRSEKAKENFKRANSAEVKGFPYHDPQTKQVKYYKRGEAPESWIRGAPVAENSGKPGAKWYYDPITNKQGRFHENEIPEGWVKGRINFGNAKPFGSNTKPVHV